MDKRTRINEIIEHLYKYADGMSDDALRDYIMDIVDIMSESEDEIDV